MKPLESAASPAPAPQIAPSLPFGVTLITLVLARVAASYPITQPVYGLISQCDAQARYTTPFNNNNPDRSLYCLGSKIAKPPWLPSPVPGYFAFTSTPFI